MNTRTTGLLIAFAFALITIGVVLFVYIRHASAPVAEPVAPVVAAEEQIQALEADAEGALQRGSAGRIQGTAKDDPERLVYDFTSERIDPQPNGVYDVESPAGWIYLENGRSIHVRAERGQVIAPAAAGADIGGRPAMPTEPEEGRLEGDVVIRVFEPSAEPIDLETALPQVTLRTDVLRFNALTGELSTPEEVEVRLETPDFTYRGTWLRGQFDEVRERFFVRVERGHQLVYAQGGAAKDQKSQPGAAPHAPPPAGADASESAAAGTEAATVGAKKIDLYHCVLAGDLMLQQVGQGRWLKADRLELWARLVDGRLPEGAIAPLAFGDLKQEGADEQARERSGVNDAAPAPGAVAATDGAPATTIPLTDTPPDEPNVITLTWSGPLVLSPMDVAPAELEDDDAAMRFSAANGNRVVLTDDGDGNIECAMLHYGATTRQATLSNVAPLERGTSMDLVTAKSEKYGGLRGPVIHADLTTGLAWIDGAGSLLPAAEDGERSARRIEWTERADFTFRTAAGRVIGSLEEALLTGLVEATDGRASLTADSVQARFARGKAGADGRRADVLSRLIAHGNVVADGGVDDRGREVGRIAAAHMDVEFDPGDAGDGTGNPTPRVIDARGAEGGESLVVTERQGERLECVRLLANTARDDDGRLIVTTVNADGKVAVWREDGIEARAGRMEADGRTQVAELFENVTLSRRGEGGAVIHGQQARVGGEDRVIEVFGPGDLEFESAKDDGMAPERLAVTWTKEMRFNDATGVIDSVGDVVATNEASELETDVLRSHRVLVQLEDASAGQENGGRTSDDGGAEALAFDGRRVKEIEAIGESMEVSGGEMATAELRRYAIDANAEGGKKLERFARLQGDRILASEVAGTLLVPGPGNAALYDARALAEAVQRKETKPADDGSLWGGSPGQIRGATLFRWDGALKGDRTEGTLVMKRAVEMVHKPLDPQQPEVLMVCENLLTRIQEPAGDAAASAEQERKISQIEAAGAVYVRADRPGTSQRKELIADRLFYDAATGMLRASADDGNRVTLFDVMRGTPIMAKVLEWDLVNDVVTVKQMSTVSSPVGK